MRLARFEDRATAHFALEWAIAEGYPRAECREDGSGAVEVWAEPARSDDWQGPASPVVLPPVTNPQMLEALAGKLSEIMAKKLGL